MSLCVSEVVFLYISYVTVLLPVGNISLFDSDCPKSKCVCIGPQGKNCIEVKISLVDHMDVESIQAHHLVIN